MNGQSDGNATWETPPLRVSIGHALLATVGAVTANQLAASLRKNQSNVKKEADRAARLGLITLCSDPPPPATQGRPARTAYRLTSKQRSRAGAELPKWTPSQPGAIGRLQRGQELVAATAAPPHTSDLLHVIAEAEEAQKAAWLALCGEEMLFAFDGPDPVSSAFALLTLLDAAEIPARRGTISQVDATRNAVERARDTVERSRTARARRRTRQT
jgi:hypothetical protein